MKRRHLLGYGASLSALTVAAGGIKRAFAQAADATKNALSGLTPEMRQRYLDEIARHGTPPATKRAPDEMLKDPWSKPINRAPINKDIDVLICGAGWAGTCTGARLTEAGVTNFMIVDKSGDFGGTWYWNRYPGAQCDDMSLIYMQMLEETHYIPTMKYASQWEIGGQMQRIAKQYGLYDKALFLTRLNGITWDDKLSRWVTETSRGDKIRARFVITGTGPLDNPKLPAIKGVETFKGKMFHTARWDYEYTGGSNKDPRLVNLKDKRVGIIGTGATGIQVIPFLGEWSKELTVFQRTPADVGPRQNAPVPKDFAQTYGSKPGWQQALMMGFAKGIADEGTQIQDLFKDDGFSQQAFIREKLKKDHPEMTPAQIADIIDFQRMQGIRDKIDRIVKDKKTAEDLKPYYQGGCKRGTWSDTYYPTFNRPTVHLLSDPKGPEDEIVPEGVMYKGKLIPLDCLVLSSGFEFATPLFSRQGFDPVGRGGLKMSDYWKDGALTYHGIFIRNFPNLLLQTNVQFGAPANHAQQSEYSARHFAYIMKTVLAKKINTVEPTQEAQDKWVDLIVTGGAADTTSTFVSQVANQTNRLGCPGGANFRAAGENAGSALAQKRNGSLKGGLNEAMRVLDAWAAKGDLDGLETTKLTS